MRESCYWESPWIDFVLFTFIEPPIQVHSFFINEADANLIISFVYLKGEWFALDFERSQVWSAIQTAWEKS